MSRLNPALAYLLWYDNATLIWMMQAIVLEGDLIIERAGPELPLWLDGG